MRGTIQKKGKQYYAVVYDGIDPGTGKKRRRWVAAGTRRDDAERVLSDLIRRKYEGEPVPTDKLTVAQYLTQRWLPIQKTRVRSSTYDSYRRNIDLHVVPGLGRRRLDKLTPEDVDLFYATRLTEGRRQDCGGRGAGLAPKTVRNTHLMLSKAMADAARRGIVPRNVVALADAPSVKGRRRGGIKAWDAAQLRVFLDAVRSHRLHPAFHLAAHTGMRRGEVLGLRSCEPRPRGRPAVGAPGARLDRVRRAGLRREDRDRTAHDRCRLRHGRRDDGVADRALFLVNEPSR